MKPFKCCQKLNHLILIQHPFPLGLKVIKISMQPFQVNMISFYEMILCHEIIDQLILRDCASLVCIDFSHYILAYKFIVLRGDFVFYASLIVCLVLYRLLCWGN